MEVIVRDDGLERFIYSLQKRTIAKVLRTLDLLEMFGNKLGMPHSKKIAPKLFELRIRGEQEVRILYTFSDSKAILLTGFVKKSEKIPWREIERARRKLALVDSI